MHNPEKFIGTYSTIEFELKVFEEFVLNYRRLLNDASIWLFLATTGCWSVNHHAIQIFAFIFVAYLFFEQLSIYKNNSKSFKDYLLIIENRVHDLVPDDKTRNDWLRYIEEYKQTNISTINNIQQVRIFILSFFFYTVSLMYFVRPDWFGA